MTDVELLEQEIIDGGIILSENIGNALYSMSAPISKTVCAIGINKKRLSTQAEIKTALLHEQAHCVIGAFYSKESPVHTRQKMEYRADKHVAEHKITKSAIIAAQKYEQCDSIYDLAEYFNVTVQYMKKMMYIHFRIEYMD